MEPSTSTAGLPPSNKRRIIYLTTTTIQSLNEDIICNVFSFLDFIHLIRCSAVCKSWSRAIDKSKLLQALYNKQKGIFGGEFSISTFSGRTWKRQLQDFAISQHRSCLHAGSVDIYQWKGHSDGINRCKMKMGLLLTGGTGKVMRLWSIERYKCLAEYYLPHTDSLIDFNFDESKVVGLVGNHICLWRRNERKSIFSSHGGQFPRSSCMCYVDPEAVVGGEDGRARVFDMYGRKWSRIIKCKQFESRLAPFDVFMAGPDSAVEGLKKFGGIDVTPTGANKSIERL